MGFSRSLFPIAGLITRMNETLFVRRADELNQKSSSGYIVFITQLSSRLILCAKLTIAPASNDRKDKGLVMPSWTDGRPSEDGPRFIRSFRTGARGTRTRIASHHRMRFLGVLGMIKLKRVYEQEAPV